MTFFYRSEWANCLCRIHRHDKKKENTVINTRQCEVAGGHRYRQASKPAGGIDSRTKRLPPILQKQRLKQWTFISCTELKNATIFMVGEVIMRVVSGSPIMRWKLRVSPDMSTYIGEDDDEY